MIRKASKRKRRTSPRGGEFAVYDGKLTRRVKMARAAGGELDWKLPLCEMRVNAPNPLLYYAWGLL
jgi:hypothetical protein